MSQSNVKDATKSAVLASRGVPTEFQTQLEEQIYRGIMEAGGGGGGGGTAGATFTPAVSDEGVISWTNNGGLPNPEPKNIKGPKGDDGEGGPDGKSAYELAVQHGFQGSEEDYLTSISKIQLAEPALDWANVVDVTAAVTTEGNYTVRQFTAPIDGLVVFACTGASKSISQASSATGLVISVNGYTTQAGNVHRSASTMALSQRVSAGDAVRCMFITGDATFNSLVLVPVKASNSLLRTYNTTEADTGKLWIDGKAIYRIAWEGNVSNTTGAWNTLKAVPGVDKVISLSGVFSAGPNFCIPANYYTEATSMGLVAYSNGNLMEYHASNAYSGKPLRVIFEYTKA